MDRKLIHFEEGFRAVSWVLEMYKALIAPEAKAGDSVSEFLLGITEAQDILNNAWERFYKRRSK